MASAVATELEVRRVPTDDAVAASLLDAYANELWDQGIGRDPDRIETVAADYVPPRGSFIVVYEDGRAIGCGGIRPLDDGAGEVKRMYLLPEARGHGHGARLLELLEDEARRLGYERLRLDTAAPLEAAQGLYRRAGYASIPDYNGNSAAAFWFEKDIAEVAPAPRWLVWTAMAAIYLIWGSTYLAIRVMVETVPPLFGAGFRFLLAGAIFWLVLAARRGFAAMRVTRWELLSAGVAGTLLCFGGNGLVTVAEQDVPSGLAATIIASVPLWIIILRRISRDPIHPVALAGVLVGFGGVAILMLPGERPDGLSLGPMLILVLAAACWAVGSYYPRGWRMPGDALLSTSLQMIISGAVMVVLALAFGEFGDVQFSDFSTKSIAGFIWLVTAGSLVAFTAYVWLLKNAPISKVSTYAYVNPVVAIFLGWLLLSEEITSTIVVGATLIVASVALVVSRETG